MPYMREEFEAWATKHRMPIHRDGVVTDYAARCTDECWQAWKASRAALRVVLPAKRSYSMYATKHECHAFNDAIEKAKEALQQAGIEVRNA
ncbi:hypothetical protein JET97_14125 [Pseudomonas aeruginosa]|nr:hypothetical protein [Pseudomonas aeruginosa]MBI7032009.1 hypothetical protein [Pseudomonas aeruginosa]MBI7190591.1 hypothetical protein [Pseudomonas aeruginosa]MBI7207811.1 hypothetical protein [Pseudomonas aeruginosa]HCF7645819.1 hypothetical protein [Pseudomonas aeruginosa]